jgi:hypothetical protein
MELAWDRLEIFGLQEHALIPLSTWECPESTGEPHNNSVMTLMSNLVFLLPSLMPYALFLFFKHNIDYSCFFR